MHKTPTRTKILYLILKLYAPRYEMQPPNHPIASEFTSIPTVKTCRERPISDSGTLLSETGSVVIEYWIRVSESRARGYYPFPPTAARCAAVSVTNLMLLCILTASLAHAQVLLEPPKIHYGQCQFQHNQDVDLVTPTPPHVPLAHLISLAKVFSKIYVVNEHNYLVRGVPSARPSVSQRVVLTFRVIASTGL